MTTRKQYFWVRDAEADTKDTKMSMINDLYKNNTAVTTCQWWQTERTKVLGINNCPLNCLKCQGHMISTVYTNDYNERKATIAAADTLRLLRCKEHKITETTNYYSCQYLACCTCAYAITNLLHGNNYTTVATVMPKLSSRSNKACCTCAYAITNLLHGNYYTTVATVMPKLSSWSNKTSRVVKIMSYCTTCVFNFGAEDANHSSGLFCIWFAEAYNELSVKPLPECSTSNRPMPGKLFSGDCVGEKHPPGFQCYNTP